MASPNAFSLTDTARQEFTIVPRGPLYKENSPTADASDSYRREILTWRESAREEARRMYRMNDECMRIADYVKYLQGQFWDARRPRYKSRFVDNRLQKARYDELAMLTDTRPVIDVTTPVEQYKQTAQVIDKTIRYEWQRQDLDVSLVYAADIAMAYGTSFWKIGAAKPGITKITPCGPDQVMPIQPGFHIQESTGVLYRTWKSINWLKRTFPFSAAGIEREAMSATSYGTSASESPYVRPDYIDEWVWNGLAPGMRRLLGVKAPAEDFTRPYFQSMEVEEFYIDDLSTNDSKNTVVMRDPYLPLEAHNWWYVVKPGQRLYPRKRLVVFAGSRVLYDGPSPFWHGLYPFATMRLNPVFWSFWGLSKYRDLIPLNQAMNEIIAGILDAVKTALNPTAITKEGAVPPAAWNQFFPGMPGSKLRVGMNVPMAEALRYMDPPNIPAYVVQVLQGLQAEFDRMSGAMDVQNLGKKKQIPGGDTLEQMRDSQQTGLRLEGRMIEVFLRDAGVQAVSNICQFYSTAMRILLFGPDGTLVEDFNADYGNMLPSERAEQPFFWKNFSLNVVPGSLHSGAKDRTKQMAIALAMRGLISKAELYRQLEIPNAAQIMQELQQEAQEGLGPAKAGRTPRGGRGQRTGQPY